MDQQPFDNRGRGRGNGRRARGGRDRGNDRRYVDRYDRQRDAGNYRRGRGAGDGDGGRGRGRGRDEAAEEPEHANIDHPRVYRGGGIPRNGRQGYHQHAEPRDRQQQVAPVAGNNDDRPAVRPQQRGFDRQPADAAPLRNEDQRNGGQANRLRKRLTYRDLQHMTDQSPEELLDVMTKKTSGFHDALDDDDLLRRPDAMTNLLMCMGSALECERNDAGKIHLLNRIRTSKFLTAHLSVYFANMMTETSGAKLRSFKQPIKNSLSLLHQLLHRLPASATPVQIAFATLSLAANDIRTRSNVIDDDVEASLKLIQELIDESTKKLREDREWKNKMKGEPMTDVNQRRNRRPPNNFREMSIFPDAQDDIHSSEKPFLRENVIKGGFQSVEDYLDIQFRLLREDFIRPLRNGIREYLEFHAAEADGLAAVPRRRRRGFNDIRVYHDVCVLNPVCTPNGIRYRIRFDASRLHHVKWRYSKRLIFGSLLCLSSDDFTSVHIATVADRDPEKLKDGKLEINFEKDEEIAGLGQNAQDIRPDQRFVMVETSGYFEAFRHVLSALKTTQQNDVPFIDNIVHCERVVEHPQYLLTADEPEFDLRAIAGIRRPLDDAGANDDNDEDLFTDDQHLAFVPILNSDAWPPAATLHLDDSQLHALKTALTRRIAIIQGPPGTGKTFLGLKIVQTLIDNCAVWNRNDDENVTSPILVVCYTNHALDQFLEGMCSFLTRGIVRVGGRSKSKKMEQFLLKEQRRKMRESRDVPRRIYLGRLDARIEIDTLQAQIERNTAMIESTERGLLHEEVLREFMLVEHYEDLISSGWPEEQADHFELLMGSKSVHGPSVLPLWLEIINDEASGETENRAPNGAEPNARHAQVHDNDDDDDDDDDDNGARAEEEERRLEVADEDDEANQRRLQEQQRLRRNVERADEQLAVNLNDMMNNARQRGEVPAGNDGMVWEEQRDSRKKRKQRLRRQLRKLDKMTDDDVELIHDVWALPVDDRWKLYRYWVGKYIERVRENILDVERNFQIAADRFKEILEEEDMAVMSKMKVIGMTTTGAARYINVLRRIQPKIVVVEEAAEVLEAHTVAPLSEGCEHLILIGDHQQLRPSPQVYDLAENYNLKYSLFERLVTNKLDHVTLRSQHRMRPEIADIMRLFYKDLTDDASVKSYPNVKGVTKNMYFINHSFEEHHDDELKSVSNEHEARYVIALGNYLVQQGYSTSQITILTPYIGQVFLIRRLMKDRPVMKGVHVCPIDNFQGEENDIVLLSLVRSNEHKTIGFLKEENRICVALSRAKIGFYAIGNFQMLLRCSERWSKIIAKAREMRIYGPSLLLSCQNHPNEARIETKTAADFNNAPEGGCMRQCGYRLECGHACERVCHPYDRDHSEYKCPKPCQKILCNRGHKCSLPCYRNCGQCMELVLKRLRCGHEKMVPCSVTADEVQCDAPCTRQLPCGDRCQKKCGEECTTECSCTRFRNCPQGHRFMIKCSQQNDVVLCKEPCKARLDCDHGCSGSCGKCFSGRLHTACSSKCDRTLICGHPCDDSCSSCPPCRRRCENRCNHSQCPRECGRPCQPCCEPCLWQCSHYRCTKLCHEPCNRPRCNEPCTRQLHCGHPCIGMCGETCPSKCRICDRQEVTEIFFGNEDDPQATFVQLEDCGHLFEVNGMDQWMDSVTDSGQQIQLKQCPQCRVTIRRNLRYGTVINRVLHDIEGVKKKMVGNHEENRIKIHELLRRTKRLKVPENFKKTYEVRLKIAGLSDGEVACMENTINFLEHIVKLQDEISLKIRDVALPVPTKRNLVPLKKEVEYIMEWLMVDRSLLSPQQLRESSMEITRLDLLFDFYVIDVRVKTSANVHLTDEKKQQFHDVMKIMTGNTLRMTEDLERQARDVLTATKKCLSGLGVSEKERLQIVNAMGGQPGHWFKCPNGHFYIIADCGGAEVEARCGECNARIGGGNHRLRDDNRFAPEVDNAAAPAWPTMDANR